MRGDSNSCFLNYLFFFIKGKDINNFYRLAAEEGLPIKQTMEEGQRKLDTREAVEMLKPKIDDIHIQLSETLKLNDVLLGGKSKRFNFFP